jgi:Ketopantoate reductase
VKAESDPAAVGPDVVFFAVKLYDTESALSLLAPLVGPRTVVVGFQNGVETVGTLTRAVGASHTAGGVSYVSAVIAEPGVIRHTAMDHLIFGMPDGSPSPQLESLLEACRPAGFQVTLSRDITVDIWTKFVRISVFSAMTAVTRSPIGVIVNDPELLEMLKAAARETLAVAHAKGVNGIGNDRRGRCSGLQGATAAGEGVDARGSGAGPPNRAPLVERRCRPART